MTGRLVVAVAACVLIGCGGPLVPTPTAAELPSASPSMRIEHPTGAFDLVLRMWSGGGLPLNVGPTYSAPPTFTLYGDGRVIYVPSVTAMGAPPPDVLIARMTDDQIGSLLEYALTTGGLANARARYEEPAIFDAGTTYFQVNAAGVGQLVSVNALSFERADGPDQAARRGFKALADLLGNFGRQVSAGNAVAVGTFEPETYEVTLDRHFGPEITANSPWPWTDLRPADFGAIAPMGSATRGVSAEQGATVLALGLWNHLIVTGPDGILYQIRIRPLLPDEIARETGLRPLLELPLANAGR